MIFCGNISLERLMVNPNDDPHSSHYIDITMDTGMPVFYVTCCCDTDWEWGFWYSKTNYESIKYIIMDSILGCATMDELIDRLDKFYKRIDVTGCVFNFKGCGNNFAKRPHNSNHTFTF